MRLWLEAIHRVSEVFEGFTLNSRKHAARAECTGLGWRSEAISILLGSTRGVDETLSGSSMG